MNLRCDRICIRSLIHCRQRGAQILNGSSPMMLLFRASHDEDIGSAITSCIIWSDSSYSPHLSASIGFHWSQYHQPLLIWQCLFSIVSFAAWTVSNACCGAREILKDTWKHERKEKWLERYSTKYHCSPSSLSSFPPTRRRWHQYLSSQTTIPSDQTH